MCAERLGGGRRSGDQGGNSKATRRTQPGRRVDDTHLIGSHTREAAQDLSVVNIRGGHNHGLGRIDRLTVHQGWLMELRGREFFTGGDIDEVGSDAEDEQTQDK